jgi:putative radical SAM enzyme (TIGR03279 family)
MALRIETVKPGSLADQAQVQPGQLLMEMSGRPVRDILDYQFFLHDENVQLVLKDDSAKTRAVSFHKEFEEDLGIGLPPIHPKRCGNNCIFCFVDQLPPGMRKSLYFKDEDYRLSFLQGSYITMTDLRDQDLERIIQQRLSPLFVSVHSTDESVRRRLLGRRQIPNITELISQLARGGIRLHCQLLVCPGINDDHILRTSVEDLSHFFPSIQSVAIVPIGLTAYRQGLPQLRSMTPEEALPLIQEGEVWQREFRKRFGRGFVYLSDEIFLLAKEALPSDEYYDDFPQRENGVGMVRHFLDQFQQRQRTYPARLPTPKAITLVTGTAAAPFMRETVAQRLSKVGNLSVHLVVVPNDFFGGAVSVSGLLTASDILKTLRHHVPQGTVILPPNCLNAEGLFLDDVGVDDLEEKLGVEVKSTSRDHPFRSIEEVW